MGTYDYYESQYITKKKRRNILGKEVKKEECVGYCACFNHTGFVTRKIRQQHDCLGKNCHYYVSKVSIKQRKTPV